MHVHREDRSFIETNKCITIKNAGSITFNEWIKTYCKSQPAFMPTSEIYMLLMNHMRKTKKIL